MLLIIICRANAERTFLSLENTTDPNKVKWNTKACRDPLTDISFALPGSTGLTTGRLTLSSVSIGQMSTLSILRSQDYSSLPVKVYKLSDLNIYGTCLGLQKARSVMEWAEQYAKYLGATKCDDKTKVWGPCADLDNGPLTQDQVSELNRRDFLLISPTLTRHVGKALSSGRFNTFLDRHFTATTVVLPSKFRSVRRFWKTMVKSMDEVKRKVVPRPNTTMDTLGDDLEKMPEGVGLDLGDPSFELDYGYQMSFRFYKSAAVVCLCNNGSLSTGVNSSEGLNFSASDLANTILKSIRENREKVYYSEPECSCHTMDVSSSNVTCPRVMNGIQPQGEFTVATDERKNELYATFSELYGVARDAPYLRPYVSQTQVERCFRWPDQNVSLVGYCSGYPFAGANTTKERIVSCDVLSSGIHSVFLGFANITRYFEEGPTVEILRLILKKETGRRDIAAMLSSARGSILKNRIFEERLENGIREHPEKLSRQEFWLLVALPTAGTVLHFLYELMKATGILRERSKSRRESLLLAALDLALESITAAFLWVSVTKQARWQYERCMEVPFPERVQRVPTVELLVTHCTEVSMKPDFAAAIVATGGALFAAGLLGLGLSPKLKKILVRGTRDTISLEDISVLKMGAKRRFSEDVHVD